MHTASVDVGPQIEVGPRLSQQSSCQLQCKQGQHLEGQTNTPELSTVSRLERTRDRHPTTPRSDSSPQQSTVKAEEIPPKYAQARATLERHHTWHTTTRPRESGTEYGTILVPVPIQIASLRDRTRTPRHLYPMSSDLA